MRLAAPAEIEALRATLARRFRTVESPFVVGERRITLLHPVSADDLINEQDFEIDERLPYWADVWPSARVLADRLTSDACASRKILELGCGAGLVSATAAVLGAILTTTDYYADALEFTRLNVAVNAGVWPAHRLVDWRSMPSDLGRFDVVLASDVLYEGEYGELVARAIDRTLAARGHALIADPGRIAARDFLAACATRGISVAAHDRIAFVEGAIRQRIDLYRLVRR